MLRNQREEGAKAQPPTQITSQKETEFMFPPALSLPLPTESYHLVFVCTDLQTPMVS